MCAMSGQSSLISTVVICESLFRNRPRNGSSAPPGNPLREPAFSDVYFLTVFLPFSAGTANAFRRLAHNVQDSANPRNADT